MKPCGWPGCNVPIPDTWGACTVCSMMVLFENIAVYVLWHCCGRKAKP